MRVSSRRLLAALFLCGTAPVVLLIVASLPELRSSSVQRIVFFGATVGACASAVVLGRCRARGVWGMPAAFVAVCCVFHFGLIGGLGLGLLGESSMTRYAWYWVEGEAATEAAVLSALGVWACCAGALGALLVRGPEPASGVGVPSGPSDARFATVLSLVGATVSIGALVTWLMIAAASGGIGTILGPYGNYLAAVATYGGVLAAVWLGLGLGAIALAVGAPRPARTVGMIALTVFGAVGFPLGLRGELLFPLVAAGAAKALAGWRPRMSATLLGLVVLLGAVAFVRGFREHGFTGARTGSLSVSALDGLAELGGSLHPVERVVLWRDQGEPALLGASYVAPFDRAISRLVPWLERPDAESDPRVLDIVVQNRVGPIGFSVIAEAFYNWRAPGVLVVMFVLGVALDGLDRLGRSVRGRMLAGALLLPLLVHVRNGFVFVPGQMLVGTLFVVAVSLVARARLSTDSRVLGPLADPEGEGRRRAA